MAEKIEHSELESIAREFIANALGDSPALAALVSLAIALNSQLTVSSA